MSSLPTIMFVPGAWHTSAAIQRVIDLLSSDGYESIRLHLPSISGKPVVKDMEPDRAIIRSTVAKLVEEGKDVVMVSHSYGGVPTTSSLEGLSKTERAKTGKNSGVIKSCMIAAFLVDFDQSLFHWKELPPWQRQEGETLIPKDTDKIFYNNSSPVEANYWDSQLLPHARMMADARVTYAAWMIIPVHYLLCQQDNAIPLVIQQQMCDDARKASGSVETESIDASHSPFLSQPDVVATWIRKAAEDGCCERPRIVP